MIVHWLSETPACVTATVKLMPHLSPLNELNDHLYIKQELRPCSRHWKRELREKGVCKFSYHDLEYVEVKWDGDYNHPVYVRDL